MAALVLFRPEMIPIVTVLSRPPGLPTAMTISPTCKLSESPSSGTGRPSAAVVDDTSGPSFLFSGTILRTAISTISSMPLTTAWYTCPSVSVTVTLVASSTLDLSHQDGHHRENTPIVSAETTRSLRTDMIKLITFIYVHVRIGEDESVG